MQAAGGLSDFRAGGNIPGNSGGTWEDDSAHRAVSQLRFNDDTHYQALMSRQAACQLCQRLPIAVRSDTHQENVHRTFASQPQAPDQVVTATHVVAHDTWLPGADHSTRIFAQVTLEASAREQSR